MTFDKMVSSTVNENLLQNLFWPKKPPKNDKNAVFWRFLAVFALCHGRNRAEVEHPDITKNSVHIRKPRMSNKAESNTRQWRKMTKNDGFAFFLAFLSIRHSNTTKKSRQLVFLDFCRVFYTPPKKKNW